MLTAPHKSWIREREPGRLLHFQKGPTRGNPPNAICYSLGGAGIKESFGALLPRLEPVLIGAELLVHSRIRLIVRRFVEWRIVLPDNIPLFLKAIESAVKIRNSVLVELTLLAIVYIFGLWAWSGRAALGVATWYALTGGRWNLTPAGYWYLFVSLPVFQFILLRWYMRLLIWFRLLWQVNRHRTEPCADPS